MKRLFHENFKLIQNKIGIINQSKRFIMQNNPKKAEVPCPICSHKFIPEAFHLERIIMDSRDGPSGTHIVSDRNVMNEIPIKPSNHIRKVWITNCPQCNYVLRFTAEVAKKD